MKFTQILQKTELFYVLAAASAKHRERALEVAKKKSTEIPDPIHTKEERLAGGTKGNEYNFDIISLEGLVLHLTQRLATQSSSLKQKISDKLKKAQQDPQLLKFYLDNVAKAARSGDKKALLIAVKELHQQKEKFVRTQPEVIAYVLNARASKFFYRFRDLIRSIAKFADEPTLTEQQQSMVQQAIVDGNNLLRYYTQLAILPLEGHSIPTNYSKPLEIIRRIIDRLKSDS